jgi:hypothetical protein
LNLLQSIVPFEFLVFFKLHFLEDVYNLQIKSCSPLVFVD